MAVSDFAPLSAGELAGFCGQLAMLLRAGVSAADGVALLREDCEKSDCALLEALSASLETGSTLADALAQTKAFPSYLVDMAEIGERSGRLDDVYSSLTAKYARERDVSDALRGAAAYPLVMLGMMLAVLAVLASQVLPVFAQVFEQFGGGASDYAQGVMRMGTVLAAVSLCLACLLGAGVVWFFANSRSEKGKRRIRGVFSRLGVTKKLSERIALGRFSSAMAMLLKSGFDMDASLEMSSRLVRDDALAARIADCREKAAGGMALQDALRQSGIFTGMSARIAAVGVRTGSLDAAMQSIADRCGEETENEIAALVGVTEPTLVAALSVVVGLILLSVMLPLLGIMSAIG